MKLSQLASKPQLIQIIIDDADVVAEFGETIEFWTWDRQPLEVFMKLANAQTGDTGMMIDIVKTLILDEQGQTIIVGENMLPTSVLMLAIQKIVEKLGK